MAPRVHPGTVNGALDRRLAVLGGLALAAAVAIWWLGGSRLALEDGSATDRVAADALHTLWLARGTTVAWLSVRVGAGPGWRPGAAAALGLIAPAWPLAVLAWSASTLPLAQLLLLEMALLAAGLVLPLIGLGLRRLLRDAERAEPVATALGVALAAGVWATQGPWTLPWP